MERTAVALSDQELVTVAWSLGKSLEDIDQLQMPTKWAHINELRAKFIAALTAGTVPRV